MTELIVDDEFVRLLDLGDGVNFRLVDTHLEAHIISSTVEVRENSVRFYEDGKPALGIGKASDESEVDADYIVMVYNQTASDQRGEPVPFIEVGVREQSFQAIHQWARRRIGVGETHDFGEADEERLPPPLDSASERTPES